MKKSLYLLLLLAAPAGAKQYPSLLSVGMEGGMSWGSLADRGNGRLYGARIKYDVTPRWAAAARFNSRTFKLDSDQSQGTRIQPISGVAFYNLREPGPWTPYAFAELGFSRNRSTVFSKLTTSQKPMYGLGVGIENRSLPFNAFGLELAHRRFGNASPGALQVSETAVAVTISFYIPDEWMPIRPDIPLKIPDMEDPAVRIASTPMPDLEKRQAQEQLDKVQLDIRERRSPPIHFETGQAVLLAASFETLDIVGTILRRYPQFSVVITGHTDEVGTGDDNQILSLARAEVVRAYLIQNFGLPTDKLSAEGAGETQPISDNTTDEGRFLNRRVEFTIQP